VIIFVITGILITLQLVVNEMDEKKVLVLMYHDIVETSSQLGLYDVSMTEFQLQMEYLSRLTRGKSNPLKYVLTFDDEYR